MSAPPAGGECRICRDGASAGALAVACRCATAVHPACLRRWVAHRADALFPLLLAAAHDTCEVCRAPFLPHVLRASDPAPAPDPARDAEAPLPPPDEHALPARLALLARPLAAAALSVEGCLLLFLLVLAVVGHVAFLVGMYDGAEPDQYSIARVALGVANAVLTISLLVLVQKLVTRWLREAHADGKGQVVLGGVLSAVAAAEIFVVVRALPFGGSLR